MALDLILISKKWTLLHSLGPSFHTVSPGVSEFHTAGSWILITEPIVSSYFHTCKGQDLKHTNPLQFPTGWILNVTKQVLVEKRRLERYGGYSVKDVSCHALDLGPDLVHDGEWFKFSTRLRGATEQTRQYEGQIASHYLKAYLALELHLIGQKRLWPGRKGNLWTGSFICLFKNHCKCQHQGLAMKTRRKGKRNRCTCRFFLQDLARREGGRCLGIKVNKTLSMMPSSHLLDQEAGGDWTVTKERQYRRESDGEERVQEQTPRTETRGCSRTERGRDTGKWLPLQWDCLLSVCHISGNKNTLHSIVFLLSAFFTR